MTQQGFIYSSNCTRSSFQTNYRRRWKIPSLDCYFEPTHSKQCDIYSIRLSPASTRTTLQV